MRTPRLAVVAMALLMAMAMLILAAGLGGCLDQPCTTCAAVDYLPATSPAHVMTNLVSAFTHRDIGGIESMLSTDFPRRSAFVDSVRTLLSGSGWVRMRFDVYDSRDDPRTGHTGWRAYDVETTLIVHFTDSTKIVSTSNDTLYFHQEPPGSSIWKLGQWAAEPWVQPAPSIPPEETLPGRPAHSTQQIAG